MSVSPITLSGGIVGLVANRPQNIGSEELRNPSDRGIWIDELQFSLTATGLNYLDFGGVVYVDLKLGREPLTGSLTTVSMCAIPGDRNCELAGLYQWPLRPALYLAPGEKISAQFTYIPPANVPPSLTDISDGFAWPSSVNIKVTALGREGGVATVQRALPYATAYVAPVRDGNSGAFEDLSNESHLVNPFSTDLNLHRIVGRYYIGGMEALGGYLQANEIDIPLNQVTVKMADWLGNQPIKDPTPFYAAFPPNGHGWSARTVMPRNAFFTVDIAGALSGFANISCQPMISLVGYRLV